MKTLQSGFRNNPTQTFMLLEMVNYKKETIKVVVRYIILNTGSAIVKIEYFKPNMNVSHRESVYDPKVIENIPKRYQKIVGELEKSAKSIFNLK